jgi:hypothetical protein
MNPIPADLWFTGFLTAAVIMVTAIGPAPAWYLTIILLALFVAIFRLTWTRHDRIFYLVCAGELLVVACGAVSIWGGLVVAWMLSGIVATALGMTGSRNDIVAFLTFCFGTLLGAMMIQLANHVLFPLFILCSGTAILLAVQTIRDYQFRKQYSEARS